MGLHPGEVGRDRVTVVRPKAAAVDGSVPDPAPTATLATPADLAAPAHPDSELVRTSRRRPRRSRPGEPSVAPAAATTVPPTTVPADASAGVVTSVSPAPGPSARAHPFRAPLDEASSARLVSLQERISVTFRRQELLREAMTHASWNNERNQSSGPGEDNERLEYLGDAVLELVVGEHLFRRFPGYDEGQLTQLRAALVNTNSLARLAERLDLGETLLLGRGAAKTGARQLPSLLANSFEALIGAIFLDQGYRVATRVFLQNVGSLDEWTDANFKGKLQEVSQDKVGATPRYRVVPSGGPGHRREYSAEAIVGGDVVGEGRGGTKQAAEQAAARAGLDRLSVVGKSAASRVAGVARDVARGATQEPARVRRRVIEVAADRDAADRTRSRSRSASAPASAPASVSPPPTEARRRGGLLGALRTVAEALVGTGKEAPPPVEPSPPVVSDATQPRPRSRRGHRGGRGRRPSGDETPP